MRNRHDEKAIAFFGTWMVFGLFLDGWAHGAEKPETFFSPWHLILYSGFGAAVAYFAFRGVVLGRRTEGDRLATVGLVLFIAGAVGDGVWHQIFGIEVDLEALLSPTHLALMIGGLMMLGIAYRMASNAVPREDNATGALVVTMTLGAAVTMFFTQYFNAFRWSGLWEGRNDDIWQIHTIGAVFVTNGILLGLVFLLVRRWTTPSFVFTFCFAALAAGVVLLDGASGPMLQIPGAALGGLATDLLVARLRPRESVRAARAFSVLVPLFVWGFWLLGIQVMDGVHWAAELWTGTLVLACLEGVVLGMLAFPGAEPTPPDATDVAMRQAIAS